VDDIFTRKVLNKPISCYNEYFDYITKIRDQISEEMNDISQKVSLCARSSNLQDCFNILNSSRYKRLETIRLPNCILSERISNLGCKLKKAGFNNK
jgi:hypothetical protein